MVRNRITEGDKAPDEIHEESIEAVCGLVSDEDGSLGSSSDNVPSGCFKLEVENPEESHLIRERTQWDNQMEFLMSCISMSVGLGNIWRFPVTAYKNGGGAFLIPYLIVWVTIGRPIYFLELTLGQFSSYSQVKAWKLVPLFKGVGYGAMISTMSVITYYVYIMALTVYYFFASFQSILPWSRCDEEWAGVGSCNGTASGTNASVPEMYFIREVIKEANSLEDGVGLPDLKLAGCLVLSWVFIFVSLINGVQSSGKVSYFTAIFPYLVMSILLVRGLTLDGAWTGIEYFIKPRWEKLLEPGVWYAAVTQCFFSLNACFGSVIMFASHNPFRHNVYRDAWIVTSMDTFTSLFAGLTIFAVLGNFAAQLGTDIDKVVSDGGASLAFVSYAEALAKLDWCPQFFAALFFLMLFTLGLGSTLSDVGTVIVIFCDRFPKAVRRQVTLVACITGCALGMVYTAPGGQFILDLVDFYGGSFVIFVTAILEIVGIAWVYGLYNYLDDIEFMLNIRLGCYWKICWGLIIPVFMTIILFYSLIAEDLTPTHNGIPYPVIALVFGWIIACIVLLSLPAAAIHSMTRVPGSLKEKFFGALQPSSDWGPRDAQHRLEWMEFKSQRPQISFLDRVRQNKL